MKKIIIGLIFISLLLIAGCSTSRDLSDDEARRIATEVVNILKEGQQEPVPSSNEPIQKLFINEDDDPVLGDKDAPVTIVSFEDFQCPFCGRAFKETFPLLKKDYIDAGKVKYVYRDFPLEFHPEAQPAAEAAECADEEGKFWEYHDEIYSNQNLLGPVYYEDAAEKLGLDILKFRACISEGRYRQEVLDDYNYGASMGVTGTPTFFINGIKLVGALPYQEFKKIIENELLN